MGIPATRDFSPSESDGFHEWDTGEAHRGDVLDSQGNREINKQKLGKRRQNLQSNR